MKTGKSAMSDAYNALAGLPDDFSPASISRNENTLEAAFEEIDNLKIEIDFLKNLINALSFAIKGK